LLYHNDVTISIYYDRHAYGTSLERIRARAYRTHRRLVLGARHRHRLDRDHQRAFA